jgi:hypothetical protein
MLSKYTQFHVVFNFGRQSKVGQFKLKIVSFQLKPSQLLMYDHIMDINYSVTVCCCNYGEYFSLLIFIWSSMTTRCDGKWSGGEARV